MFLAQTYRNVNMPANLLGLSFFAFGSSWRMYRLEMVRLGFYITEKEWLRSNPAYREASRYGTLRNLQKYISS